MIRHRNSLRIPLAGVCGRVLGRLGVLATVTMLVCVGGAGSAVGEPSEQPFEIVPGSFHLTPSSLQAGAHANLTTTFDFAHNAQQKTFGDVRTTVVNLPPGFIGNNTAVPTCSVAQLLIPTPRSETLTGASARPTARSGRSR